MLSTKILFVVGYASIIIPCAAQMLPDVIPPTPEASALFKYMEYPVDYSTGIPNINIPIYQIRSGDLSLPVSLSYHSSGRKVYDETGAIGLGWSLIAGGMISRTIYGDPDDDDHMATFPVPFRRQADINTANRADNDFLQGILGNNFNVDWFDTEYDIFSYSAGSISGKFVLRDDNNVKSAVLLPLKPYKVSFNKATTQTNVNYFNYINIIDDKGTLYRFGKSLKTGTEHYESSHSGSGKSSWLLTEIVSADKADTIFFDYATFVKQRNSISQRTTIVDRKIACAPGSSGTDDYEITTDNTGTGQTTSSSTKRLTSIRWRNGSLIFSLTSNSDAIETITLRDTKGQLIRSYQLTRDNQDIVSDGNPPVQTLKYIDLKGSDNALVERYTFDYYPTYYTSATLVNLRQRDYWGYYNASAEQDMRPTVSGVSVTGAISTSTVTIGADFTTNRQPNLEATKSGVLKKITFPTGGSVEYTYEQNKYDNASTAGPGLRVAQIVSSDNAGGISYKTYKYGIDESGYGEIPFRVHESNMLTTHYEQEYTELSGHHYPHWSRRVRVYFSDVLPIFSEFNNLPITYREVTEYFGTPEDNAGKTVYKYDGDGTTGFASSIMGLFSSGSISYWKNNSLVEKIEYKRNDGTWKKLRSTKLTYDAVADDNQKVWGLKVGKMLLGTPQDLINSLGQNVPSYFPFEIPQSCQGNIEIFRFSDYSITTGTKQLTRNVVQFFDEEENATIEEVETFQYNSRHLISNRTKSTSHGEDAITATKYPFDFPSDPVCVQMVANNMLDVAIESSAYLGAKFLNATRTSYKDWGSSMIKPEVLSYKHDTAPFEERIRFHAYDDEGNILSMAKDGGPTTVVLWNKRERTPVAKAINAQLHTTSVVTAAPTLDNDFYVPGVPTTPTTFRNDIAVTLEQDMTLTGIVSRGNADPSVPVHYLIVQISLWNDDTNTQFYGTTFSLGNQVATINNVPPGNYSLRYQYSADIGAENAFHVHTSLDYDVLQIYSTVLYEGFEALATNTSSDAYTGSRSRSGTYRVNLPAPIGTYRLTYFTKTSGSQWIFNEQLITKTTTALESVTIGASGSLLDEVRLFPVGAMMTTYSNEPLIGVTDVTDENGRPTRYYFDSFQRLQHVSDHNRNVLKSFRYHYVSP